MVDGQILQDLLLPEALLTAFNRVAVKLRNLISGTMLRKPYYLLYIPIMIALF